MFSICENVCEHARAHICWGMHTEVRVQLQESVLSFHHVGSGDRLLIITLGSRHFHPPSHPEPSCPPKGKCFSQLEEFLWNSRMSGDQGTGKQKTWTLGQYTRSPHESAHSWAHTLLVLERTITQESIEQGPTLLALQERTVKASQARMGFCQLELRWTPDPEAFSLGAPQIRGRNSNALDFPPSATLMAADRRAARNSHCVSSSRLCFRGEANKTHLKGQRGAGSWLSDLLPPWDGDITVSALFCASDRGEDGRAGPGSMPLAL